jgi:hypothetical protein
MPYLEIKKNACEQKKLHVQTLRFNIFFFFQKQENTKNLQSLRIFIW